MAVPEFLPVKPGKMIAVHVAFESRAAQRGRWPKTPSYFLKATSTLAESGGVVERPQGTELLAFEGEIALIIGTPARNVSLEDAWKHVAYVTASNDIGLYDYKVQDGLQHSLQVARWIYPHRAGAYRRSRDQPSGPALAYVGEWRGSSGGNLFGRRPHLPACPVRS